MITATDVHNAAILAGYDDVQYKLAVYDGIARFTATAISQEKVHVVVGTGTTPALAKQEAIVYLSGESATPEVVKQMDNSTPTVTQEALVMVGRVGQGTKLHPLHAHKGADGTVSYLVGGCGCPGMSNGHARITWQGLGRPTCRGRH